MANILIVGCGDLGSRAGLMLSQRGHRVFGIRRNIRQLPEAIHGIQADITCALPDLPAPLDLVLYTAAATERSEEAYRHAYQTGPKRLIDALLAQGVAPQRLLFTSSTSIYPHHRGEWVDESTCVEPTGFTGQAMLRGERIYAESPFASTSIRLSGLYGPSRYWLIRQALSGQVCPAQPPSFSNRIHRDDAAAALAFLGERALAGAPLEPCYIASDPTPAPLHEVLSWIRQRLGVEEPPPGSPHLPSRGSKRCSSKRLQDLGFRFRYPDFRSGYIPIIEQYLREHPL